MLILGVTAGLAGGCTQKTKEQSYVNITKTAAENSKKSVMTGSFKKKKHFMTEKVYRQTCIL